MTKGWANVTRASQFRNGRIWHTKWICPSPLQPLAIQTGSLSLGRIPNCVGFSGLLSHWILRWKIYRIRWPQTTGSWWEWQPVLPHPDSYSHWASISTAFTYPIKDSDNNSVSVGERLAEPGREIMWGIKSLYIVIRGQSPASLECHWTLPSFTQVQTVSLQRFLWISLSNKAVNWTCVWSCLRLTVSLTYWYLTPNGANGWPHPAISYKY